MTTDWQIDLSACQTRPLRSPGLLSRRAPKADTAPRAATLGPNAPHEGSRNPSCQLCALESNQRANENRFLIQSSHDHGCPKGRQRELLLGAPTSKAALALWQRNKAPPEQNLLSAVVEVVHCKRSLQDDLCRTILACHRATACHRTRSQRADGAAPSQGSGRINPSLCSRCRCASSSRRSWSRSRSPGKGIGSPVLE